MEDLRQSECPVSFVCARIGRRQRATALRRLSHRDDGNLGLSRHRRSDPLHTGAARAAASRGQGTRGRGDSRARRVGQAGSDETRNDLARHRLTPTDGAPRTEVGGQILGASEAAGRSRAHEEFGGIEAR